MAFRALCACTLVLGLALAGCTQLSEDPGPASALDLEPSRRPTVVALIDSGITPYHAAFRAHPGDVRVDDYLHLVGGAELVPATGPARYEAGELYAFSGTRVLAIALKNTSGSAPIIDESDHGTGTASLVAREDPKALIVMVQVEGNGCPALPEDCPIYPPISEGLEWAARQPWIDIISLSVAPPGNVPSPPVAEAARYLSASKLAHDSGKIVVTAAGNDPTPSLAQHFAGPPWIIAVGGFLPANQGEAPRASKGVDVVANLTDTVAVASTENDTLAEAGTSLATPIVAGTLSRALYEVRAALHHKGGITQDAALAVGRDASGATVRLTSKDFRDALNATAVYVAPTDWDPTKPSANDTWGLIERGVPVFAPAVQIGWGYVHGGLSHEVAEWVLSTERALPPSKITTAHLQAARQAAREAYWANVMGKSQA